MTIGGTGQVSLEDFADDMPEWLRDAIRDKLFWDHQYGGKLTAEDLMNQLADWFAGHPRKLSL